MAWSYCRPDRHCQTQVFLAGISLPKTITNSNLSLDEDELSELVKLRRDLHKHPELSGLEKRTAKRIVEFLHKHHPDKIVESIGGFGVAAVFEFHSEGPTLLFRCELDALPIEEWNSFGHKSVNLNVSHKCGHDGHMVMVAGLASLLEKREFKKGRVILLFQPAEEVGEGANAVIEDPKFENLKPDYVFALHNLPGIEKGKIICKPGSFTASVKSMIIRLTGKTSHAAEPEHGINPAGTIAEILLHGASIELPPENQDFTLTTPIHIQMGEKAYGTSAGEGELHLTLRTWINERMEWLCGEMEKTAGKLAKNRNLAIEIEWTQNFAATDNDREIVNVIESVAGELEYNYENKNQPFKWGEDFGLFTQIHPGAMFGVGSGVDCPALHNPDYDFPDEIIPKGVHMFYGLIRKYLE